MKIRANLLSVVFMCCIASMVMASNDTPSIQAAVIMNDTHLANYYLRNGGDIDAKNRNGRTALMLAAEVCNDRFINYLITKGANSCLQSPQGHTAIDFACSQEAVMAIRKSQTTLKCNMHKALDNNAK